MAAKVFADGLFKPGQNIYHSINPDVIFQDIITPEGTYKFFNTEQMNAGPGVGEQALLRGEFGGTGNYKLWGPHHAA